jgi:hypothetical protein
MSSASQVSHDISSDVPESTDATVTPTPLGSSLGLQGVSTRDMLKYFGAKCTSGGGPPTEHPRQNMELLLTCLSLAGPAVWRTAQGLGYQCA